MPSYMQTFVGSRNAIEIACTTPGNWDGCLMGYAIVYSGGWDGWVMSRHDHKTMRQVASNASKDTAIAAIVQQWDRDYTG